MRLITVVSLLLFLSTRIAKSAMTMKGPQPQKVQSISIK